MAALKEIARLYQDAIKEGIAWVVIWKEGRGWNAEAFYTTKMINFVLMIMNYLRKY